MSAGARAGVLRFLSACFSPPTQELLEAATGAGLARELRDAFRDARRPDLKAAIRALESLPEQMAEDGPYGTLEALKIEYARLFLGPGMPVAPPYESVYLGQGGNEGRGELLSEASFAVREAYERVGLTPVPGPEPPDHLGAELEFAAYLCSKGEPAGRDALEAFLNEHMRRWAPQLAATVAQESRHPFYRAAARLLAAVLV